MGTKDIEKLLADFYDGNTSLEQESELYRYLLDADAPEHLTADKKTFLALYESSHTLSGTATPDLENQLNNLIDNLEAKERFKSKKIGWKWIGSIAASVAIIVSLSIYMFSGHKYSDTPLYVDTYSDPEEAYIQTQKALLLASSKLNKGFDQLEMMNNNIEKANGIVHKIIQ